MAITLKKKPSVAPKGQNTGIFSDITQDTGEDNLGKKYDRLKVVVTLDAQDPDGKPFQVAKTYNLLGRGLREFRADFHSWSGRFLTDEELDAFDAETLMKNKPVIVDLSHRQLGKNNLEAEIEKFMPAPTQT